MGYFFVHILHSSRFECGETFNVNVNLFQCSLCRENDITSVLDHTFCVEHNAFGKFLQHELKPNGRNIPVTEENKKEYVRWAMHHLLCKRTCCAQSFSQLSTVCLFCLHHLFVFFRLYVNWRFMRGIEAQFLALQKGFSELIPQHLLKPFDHKELEVHVLSVNRNLYLEWTEKAKHKTKLYLSWSTTLSLIPLSLCQLIIGGLGKIDLADWKTNTRLKHCTSESNVVRWFWQAVEAFSEERRGRLLQFVTGSTRVPLQGFKALQGGSWTGMDTTHTNSYTH